MWIAPGKNLSVVVDTDIKLTRRGRVVTKGKLGKGFFK